MWKGLSWWQWRVDRNIKSWQSPITLAFMNIHFLCQCYQLLFLSLCSQCLECGCVPSVWNVDVILLVIHNCSHWISTFWLIICSWKNTNKEILVIAPGSIVKINICFLLVSCFFCYSLKSHFIPCCPVKFRHACHAIAHAEKNMFSCTVEHWHLHKRICHINYWHDYWIYHYTLIDY